jgi:hypothetical protein
MAGSERPAIAHLEQLARWASRQITRDTAARDAVLRPTEALVALLRAAREESRQRLVPVVVRSACVKRRSSGRSVAVVPRPRSSPREIAPLTIPSAESAT